MGTVISMLALFVSTISVAVSATWIIAQKTGLKREELTAIVDDVTSRIEKLIDKIDQLAIDSVKRQEFQDEMHILREKVTKHIGNMNIHVGHNQ